MTDRDGCELESGSLVSAEIWPPCAMGALILYFSLEPKDYIDRLIGEYEKSGGDTAIRNKVMVHGTLGDWANKYFNAFMRKMPEAFLDENRNISRINPFYVPQSVRRRRPDLNEDEDEEVWEEDQPWYKSTYPSKTLPAPEAAADIKHYLTRPKIS